MQGKIIPALLFLFFLFSLHLSAQENSLPANDRLLVVTSITLNGNKRTKEKIIYREIPFREGDTIAGNNLAHIIERTQFNVFNTLLFTIVTVDTVISANNVDVTINMQERWYIWPVPFIQIAERNFNAWWQNKDFSRLDYGIMTTHYNFRGRKEKLIGLIRLGFNTQFRLTYEIPYINKKQTLGLSFTSGYSQHKEIWYAAEENKQLFYKDTKRHVRQEIDGGAGLLYRHGLYFRHRLDVMYYHANVQDTLVKLNPDYFAGHGNNTQYLTAAYTFEYDFRDVKVYPLKGHYAEVVLTKYGLGILNNEKTDMLTAELSFKKFWELSKNFYFSSGLKAKISNRSFQPYYIQRGLGYMEDFVRSYEYYVIDGRHYAYFKSELKYALVSTRLWNMKFIKKGKFNPMPYALYVKGLFDGGYVYADQYKENNPLTNSWLYGGGIGLDFVTYYDRIFRFEYSINKLGKHGLYIHFIAPI
jgi:outer membrane protein assembly factor BamA